jgi:hypothetical protein
MGLSSNAALKNFIDLLMSGKYTFDSTNSSVTPTDLLVGGIVDRRLDEKARAGFVHFKRIVSIPAGKMSTTIAIASAVDSITGLPNMRVGVACAIRVTGASSVLPALAWYGGDTRVPSPTEEPVFLPLETKMQSFSGGCIPAGTRLFQDDSLRLSFDWKLSNAATQNQDEHIFLLPCYNGPDLAKRPLYAFLTRAYTKLSKRVPLAIEIHLLVPCSTSDSKLFPPISYWTDGTDKESKAIGRQYKFRRMPIRASIYSTSSKKYEALPFGVVAERPYYLINAGANSAVELTSDGYYDVRIKIPKFLASLIGMESDVIRMNQFFPLRAKSWTPVLKVKWEDGKSGPNLLLRVSIPEDAPLELLADIDEPPVVVKEVFLGFCGNIDIRLFPKIVNGRITWTSTVDSFIDWINTTNTIAWALSPVAERTINRKLGEAIAPYIDVVGAFVLALPSAVVQSPQANINEYPLGAPSGILANGVVWTGPKRDTDRFWTSDSSFVTYLNGAAQTPNVVQSWAIGTPYRTLLSAASQGQLETFLSIGRLRQLCFDSSPGGVGISATLIGQMPPTFFLPAVSSALNKWLGYLFLLQDGHFGPSMDRLYDRYSVATSISVSPAGGNILINSPARFFTTPQGEIFLSQTAKLGYDVLTSQPAVVGGPSNPASVQSYGALVRRDRFRAQCLEILFDTGGHFNIGSYLRENHDLIYATAYDKFGQENDKNAGSYGLINYRIEVDFKFLTRHVVLGDTTSTFTPASHGVASVTLVGEKLMEVKPKESSLAKIFLETTGWTTNAEIAADLEILVESDGYWVSSIPSLNAPGSFHPGEVFLEVTGLHLAWDAQFADKKNEEVLKPFRLPFEPVAKPQIDFVGHVASMENNPTGNSAADQILSQALAFGLPQPSSAGSPTLGTDVLLSTSGSWKVPIIEDAMNTTIVGTRWRFSRSAPVEMLDAQLRLSIKRIRLVVHVPPASSQDSGGVSVKCDASIHFAADGKAYSLVGVIGAIATPVVLTSGIEDFVQTRNTFSVTRDFGSPDVTITTPKWSGLVAVPFTNVLNYNEKGYENPWVQDGAFVTAMNSGSYRLLLNLVVNYDGETANFQMLHDASCQYSPNDGGGQPLLWGIPFGAGSVGMSKPLVHVSGNISLADKLMGSFVDFGVGHVSMQALPHVDPQFDLTPFWGAACSLKLTVTSLTIFNDLDNFGSGEYRMRIRIDNFPKRVGSMVAAPDSAITAVSIFDYTTKEIDFDWFDGGGISIGSITASPGDILQFRTDIVDIDVTEVESLPSALSWYRVEDNGMISRSKEVVSSSLSKPTNFHPPGHFVTAGANNKAFKSVIETAPSFVHVAPKCWAFAASSAPQSEKDTNPVPNSAWTTNFPIAMTHEPCLGYATGAVDSAVLLFRKLSTDPWKVLIANLRQTNFGPDIGPPYIYSNIFGPNGVAIVAVLACRLTDALKAIGENSPLPNSAVFMVQTITNGISLYSNPVKWVPPLA